MTSAAAYLATHEEASTALGDRQRARCFRLSNHEFLFLPYDISGLFYCDLKFRKTCANKSTSGGPYPFQSISAEFTDRTNTHFVLFEQSVPGRGLRTDSYDVLYLRPPGADTHGLPFIFQPLVRSVVNSDSGKLDIYACGWTEIGAPGMVPAVVSRIDSATMANSDAGHAIIKFEMKQKDCDTNSITAYARRFDFNGKKFIEVSTGLPPLNLNSSYEGFADGSASDALFSWPAALTLDKAGNLFVLDKGNAASRKITPGGQVTTVVARHQPEGTSAP